jgi:gliding motility-associated lipoprotein GldD
MVKINLIAPLTLIALLLSSCGGNDQPRPRGYFRIDLPEKGFTAFDSASAPFIFEYPVYGKITTSDERNSEPWWFNIEFTEYRAKLHISYKSIDNNLSSLLEDAYSLTYNHTIKADAIRETVYSDEVNHKSGLLYDLKGNTATAVQFWLTDSSKHFMRGSLYFYSAPNEDSLKPVIDFFREDIIHLMETVRWNY